MVETPSEQNDDSDFLARLRTACGIEHEVALRQALEEETAGTYEILEPLGRGSGGVVFKARDLKLNRIVAIKCFRNDQNSDQVVLALQEAKHLATLSHPGIAVMYGISESARVPFIVTEFVDGEPITSALDGLPVAVQLSTFVQILDAVATLHHAGVIHRDLKPANILVNRAGHVKIVDFGIAREINPLISGTAQGTPAYVAPEQSLGQTASASADVFSLGIVLFELLTGQRPFTGPTEHQLLASIRRTDPPLPRMLREDIPGTLQAIILAALEKNPARRYPSAGEFLLDIERMNRGEVVWADPTQLASALDHGIHRHLSDVRRWQRDRMISSRECDYFLDKYDRLRQREEFWILDSRRISFSQVLLHLGAWSCVVSAFLMLAFPWPHIGSARLLLPIGLLALLSLAGGVLWRKKTNRVAIVLLVGATIICPIAIATILQYFQLFTTSTEPADLLESLATDRQFLVSSLIGLFANLGLWRATRTAAFAVISCVSVVAVASAAFALLGLRQKLADGHIDSVASWYLIPGAIFLCFAMALDLRRRAVSWASPFYIAGLFLVLGALTLIARFGPTLVWIGLIKSDPPSTMQIDYSFMINGMLYFLVAFLADRSISSAWLRWIASLLFWLAPSHILIPILHLENHWPIAGTSWTISELVLPAASLFLVFISVPKQMKSCFFSGLLYSAISVQRLTSRHFQDQFGWPLALAFAGLAMTLAAWRWPRLFDKQSPPLVT